MTAYTTSQAEAAAKDTAIIVGPSRYLKGYGYSFFDGAYTQQPANYRRFNTHEEAMDALKAANPAARIVTQKEFKRLVMAVVSARVDERLAKPAVLDSAAPSVTVHEQAATYTITANLTNEVRAHGLTDQQVAEWMACRVNTSAYSVTPEGEDAAVAADAEAQAVA